MADTEEIRGIGHSVRRVEDDRFIRGAGNYIDDIHLPGMLHMAILRSPYAHANLKSVDGSKAQALEGVIAVVTGELMAQHNLAWMPTLSGDTQAVLATDKVRFQGQEVAAVIATDPYIAKDALELIEVDYEPLDPVTTPQQALQADAPVIRTDKEGQANNHIYDWETGDKEATDAAFAAADKVVSLDTFYPRCHPAPLETCGCIADVSPATGQVTIYMTSQAPHAIRTVFALVAGLPEEKIRIVLEGLRGEDSIAELCRREGIAQNLYYRWSKDFLEAGKKRLAGDTARAATSDEVKDLRREATALKEAVADLTLENRLLKKSVTADGEDEA